jgi:hypothetical protein
MYQGGVCGTRAHVPYSPTDSATSPTTAAATERHFYQHSSQSSGPTPGASFESYPSLDGAAHHAPNNTRRQDSAIAHHHRLESSKEGPPFAPLSEPDVSYSHRSPTISRPSTSPAPCSHHSSQSPAHVPSSLHTSTRSDEHVTGQPASPRFQPAQDPSPKSLSPPLSLDHSNTSNSNIRQQRYNVRFAANYTSENMSPAHRPRPSSPLQTAAAATETNESLPSTQPERAASTIDPILQNILTGTSSHPDVQSQADYLAQELKVERCPGCNEAWSRPPVHASEWGSQSPATSVHDFEKAQGNVLSRLRKFEKENDEAFDQWKKKHSQCPIIPTAPPRSAAPNAQSNKRKPEGLHSDITKLRRMNFDSNGPTAPLARPSAPI